MGKTDHKKPLDHYNQAADAAVITTKSLSNIFLGHPVDISKRREFQDFF